jgi:hypothetical protein
MTQPAVPNGHAPKKKMNGCIVALLCFAGFVVVVGLVGAYGLYRAVRSPAGARVAKAIGDTAQMMWKAQSAPGAKEVRKQAPCEQAFVLTAEDMAKLASDLSDAAVPPRAHTLVNCQVGLFRSPPTCEAVAAIYVSAAHPTAAFDVIVKKTQTSLRPECQTRFDQDGEPLD